MFLTDLKEGTYLFLPQYDSPGFKDLTDNILTSLISSSKITFAAWLPGLRNHKGKLSSMTEWLDVPVLWAVGKTKHYLNTGDESLQPALCVAAPLSRHCPLGMMDLSSTDSMEPVLWSALAIFQENKTILERIWCSGHYVTPGSFPAPTTPHDFHLLGSRAVNSKPLQHPNPAGKWKTVFKTLNGFCVPCVRLAVIKLRKGRSWTQ